MNKDRVEVIARVCHEVQRAYCESLGDRSQRPWESTPAVAQMSMRARVEAYLSGKCTSPGDSHAVWATALVRDGWTHGFAEDPVARTHPNLVPFAYLPHREQARDHLFLGTVYAMATAEGFFCSWACRLPNPAC